MKILITGGAGFIGTALSKLLVEQGCLVSVIDLKSKLSTSRKVSGVDYYPVDIADYSTLSSFECAGFDIIYHLASQTSGLISHEDPTLDVDTNVKGTLNVCRLASAMGEVKVIFTSSMAVYGDSEFSISEKTDKNPTSNYGVSKIAAERYLKLFQQRGVKCSVFRLFNVYGPGQDLTNMKQGMLSIYVTQLIQTGRIDVTGSFERYRDFVYIDDVINALMYGAKPETDGQVYNVGTGVKTTVGELIDLVVKESGKAGVGVNNIGAIVGDQFGTVSDCSKLESLGWSPKVKLEEGLTYMYKDALKELS